MLLFLRFLSLYNTPGAEAVAMLQEQVPSSRATPRVYSYYARSVIVIRHLVQHEVVATELQT